MVVGSIIRRRLEVIIIIRTLSNGEVNGIVNPQILSSGITTKQNIFKKDQEEAQDETFHSNIAMI